MAYAVKPLAWTSAAASSLAMHWIGLSLAGPPLQTPTHSEPRPALMARVIEWRASPSDAHIPAASDAAPPTAPTPAAASGLAHSADEPIISMATPVEIASPTSEPAPAPQAEGLPDPRYWPGKLLDQRPSPQAPVIIPFPEGFVSMAAGRAILQLFIDELGIVDHVDVLETEGPVEFADLARKTLLQARFAPGVKNQANVRSTIKIEVGFQRDTAPAG